MANIPPPFLPDAQPFSGEFFGESLLDPLEQQYFSDFLDGLLLDDGALGSSSLGPLPLSTLGDPPPLFPGLDGVGSSEILQGVKLQRSPPMAPLEGLAQSRGWAGGPSSFHVPPPHAPLPGQLRHARPTVQTPIAVRLPPSLPRLPTLTTGRDAINSLMATATEIPLPSQSPDSVSHTQTSKSASQPRASSPLDKKVHMASEQKRRQLIKTGFETLTKLVPGLSRSTKDPSAIKRRRDGGSISKSIILMKTVEYIRWLQNRNVSLAEEVMALQRRWGGLER